MSALGRITVTLLAGVSLVSARPPYSKRQVSNVTSSGTTGATQGGVQSRLEIHSLQQDADQWNIYLLALQAFKAMDFNDPMSYYRIAGIHGEPYLTYDGVEPCANCNKNTGYCTHSSTLFPTWHRAYLALFEQSLQNNAIEVANQFTGDDKSRYLTAAQNLRMPYWDWALAPASGENPFPQVFTDQTVSVNTPSGQQTITNPLLEYDFGGAPHSWDSSSSTTRSPTFTDQLRQQLKSDLWTTLTSQQDYNAFSTQALQPNQNDNPSSIESVHDTVHGSVGGDMGIVPYAGFDPVFWLHHAMVDRALNLYQAANPDSWLTPWNEVGDSYTYTSGTEEDSSSALNPFHAADNSNFWTSDSVRDTTVFNYNYADVASGESATEIINNLYGSGQSSNSKRAENSTAPSNSTSGNTVQQYVVNVEADSMGCEGSLAVFLFDGTCNEQDPSSWYTDSNVLGLHIFFTGPNAMGNGSALMNAGITITDALQTRVNDGRLSSLSVTDVTAYLKNNGDWRVQYLDGTVAELSSVPGLTIDVMTSTVQLPTSNNELPTWGQFTALDQCGWSH